MKLKAEKDENLTDTQLRKKIIKINKNRAKYYEYYTGKKWGDRSNYDLCVNTSAVSVKECAEALAHMLENR